MNNETYVYCTNCKNGAELITSVVNDTTLPNDCATCNPYNMEDSCPLKDRPNYKEF